MFESVSPNFTSLQPSAICGEKAKSQSTSSSFVKSRKAEAPVYTARIKPQGKMRRTPLYRENHLKTGALNQLLIIDLIILGEDIIFPKVKPKNDYIGDR